MTDQEQAERGASTMTDIQLLTAQAIVIRDLRADLERVTAELQTARSENHGLLADLDMTEKARVEALAERDAMREALLKIEEIPSRPSIADEERMSMVWQIVVLSLDATRKAMADATEKGK